MPGQESDGQDLITGIPDHLRNLPESTQDLPEYRDPTISNQLPDDDWGYTVNFKDRHGESYQGRRIIGRDTPIDNGVYFGNYGGEALVVDSNKYPTHYERLLTEVKERASDDTGEVVRNKVLDAVFETVKKAMPYSQKGVDTLLADIARQDGHKEFKDGTKVDLSMFIEDGVGVCRHQALAAGLLLEKMKAAGHIRGDISIDRSMSWNPKGERDGHAWVRYTSHSGGVWILDVAQNYNGPLEESEGRRHGWDYLRPEEKRQRSAGHIGPQALERT